MEKYKNIKIGIIIGSLQIGGAQQHVLQLINNLPKNFEIYLILGKKEGPFLKNITRPDLQIVNLSINKYYDFNAFFQLFKLALFLRKNKIDIIHGFLFETDIFGALAGILSMRTKIIISIRNMNLTFGFHKILAIRILSKFVDKVTVVSNKVKQFVEHREKISTKKLLTIYNGIDFNKYQSKNYNYDIREKFAISKNHIIIGNIASFNYRKGQDYLIKAFTKLYKINNNITLLLLGDGKQRLELEELITKNNMSENIRILGYRMDVQEIMSIFDVFVLSSLEEGMSNALLEAMAMGIPAITTDVGGNAEVNLHNITGLVIEPKNVDSLFGALRLLFHDKKLRLKYGKRAKKRIKHEFSLYKMISENEKLYNDILS